MTFLTIFDNIQSWIDQYANWYTFLGLIAGIIGIILTIYHAVVLETVAEMDIKALLVNPHSSMPQYILDKHYFRKHGANAYYGQNRKNN